MNPIETRGGIVVDAIDAETRKPSQVVVNDDNIKITVGICPECDRTHVRIYTSVGLIALILDLTPEQAELLAKHCINPQPEQVMN